MTQLRESGEAAHALNVHVEQIDRNFFIIQRNSEWMGNTSETCQSESWKVE